jgi:deoxyribodipyrimidine photolyase-related protein
LHETAPKHWGLAPDGLWATTRAGAVERLNFFVENVLAMFGPHEDAMLSDNWHLAHSLLSPYLNIGLLLPHEVVDAVQKAFDAGRIPINSAEGFIRQIIGWREYVWNMYWLFMPAYRDMNELGVDRSLPPLFREGGKTQMRCMKVTLDAIHDYSWAHHIQRLMVLGNFALLTGITPREFTNWMWDSFIDAAEWVMVPNVVGMSLYADGGRMATKPYISGGAYIDKMSDYCKGCFYDRKKRVGDDACPFTTLYWDFLLRHDEKFVKNPRVSRQVYAARKLNDGAEIQKRARDVLLMLDDGQL